jgi:hypothetical protein
MKQYVDREYVLLVCSMNTLEVFTVNYISSYKFIGCHVI